MIRSHGSNRRRVATAVSALWLVAVPAATAQDDGTIRVRTQLVMVDVVVTDGDDPIADLDAADFAVFDTGERQEIAVFDAIPGTGRPEETVAPTPGIVSNRRDWQGAVPTSATVVLVDRLNTPTTDQIYMNTLLLDFLEAFDDVGRLGLYQLGNEFNLIHDYTEDPAQLIQLARDLEPEQSLALGSSDSNSGFEASLDTFGLDRRLAEFQGIGGGRGAFAGQFQRETGDMFLENRILRTLEALESIAGHLDGLPGRKNIVWLSGRFPFAFYPHRQTDLADEVDNATLNWMENVGHLLTTANIAVYPVDVRGPGNDGDSYVAGVMREIAEMTGGRSFYGTNDIGAAITSAVDDAQVVYSLGFYPSDPAQDRSFRTIDVEVGREGADTRHRPGYFAFGGLSGQAPELGLADLLVGTLDATSIGLVSRAREVEEQPGNYLLLVLADMNDLSVATGEGRHTGEIDLASFFESSEDGTISVFPAEALPINLSDEEYAVAVETGFLITKVVTTEGHAGRIRVVVRDRATGAAGSLWVPAGTP